MRKHTRIVLYEEINNYLNILNISINDYISIDREICNINLTGIKEKLTILINNEKRGK